MPPESRQDDWIEYKRLVLAALEQSDKNYKELVKEVSELKIALTTLQTRASTWGTIGGTVSGVICSIIVALIITAIKGH